MIKNEKKTSPIGHTWVSATFDADWEGHLKKKFFLEKREKHQNGLKTPKSGFKR